MRPSLPALHRRLAALEAPRASRRSYLVEVPDRLLADPKALLVALAARGVTGFLVLAPRMCASADEWAARYGGWRAPA